MYVVRMHENFGIHNYDHLTGRGREREVAIYVEVAEFCMFQNNHMYVC